ncbi:TVA3 protein, partial [Amia calva]|nr:TVA3 protein [Amia calva]
DAVFQTQTSVLLKEGANYTIYCKYETTTVSPTLFLYFQESNKAPQHMLGLYSQTETRFRERFSALHDETGKTFNLTLSRVVLSYSATYYCALVP